MSSLPASAPKSRSFDAGQTLVVALLVVIPLGLFVALRTIPGMDVIFQSLLFHIIVVSSIAACALGVAVLVAVAAARTRRYSLVMLALGCLCVGSLMLGHGLTSPGVFGRPMNLWVARFPTLALSLFAAALGAALLSPQTALARFVERHVRGTFALAAAVLWVGTSAAVAWPGGWIGARMLAGEVTFTRILAGLAGVVLVVAGEVHRRRWRLSHDSVEIALLLACWLSAESILSLQLGPLWRLSWWDYHVLLLIGFGGCAYAVFAGYRRTRSLEGALKGVVLTSTLDRIQHGYPEAVRSLVTAVEARDSYTQGHSDRVAELSVRIGERIGLRADLLRSLAQGGLLHDIGKIGVPDRILNKPDLLSAEERAEIERHPEMGWDIVRQAPSLQGALAVVRHHHERMDGSGYPDRLAGDDIPLVARIAAVADVWDALTSDRAYRPAWAPDRALDVMLGARGTHFDAEALDALLHILDGAGIRPVGLGVVDRESLEACHPVEAAKQIPGPSPALRLVR